MSGIAWRNGEAKHEQARNHCRRDQDPDGVLAFIRAPSEERAARQLPRLGAESVLAKDWLAPAEGTTAAMVGRRVTIELV